MYLSENALTLLSSTAAISLNALAETTLYTCPTGKSCIVTSVVLRAPSAAVTTASISLGWNTANADDVIANGVRTLTGATNYIVIPAANDAVRGAAGGTFKIEVQTVEGGALTATVDVFGYLY